MTSPLPKWFNEFAKGNLTPQTIINRSKNIKGSALIEDNILTLLPGAEVKETLRFGAGPWTIEYKGKCFGLTLDNLDTSSVDALRKSFVKWCCAALDTAGLLCRESDTTELQHTSYEDMLGVLL